MRKAIIKYTDVSHDEQVKLELICWVDEYEARIGSTSLIVEECATGFLRNINNVESVQFLDNTKTDSECNDIMQSMIRMSAELDNLIDSGQISSCFTVRTSLRNSNFESMFYELLEIAKNAYKAKNPINHQMVEPLENKPYVFRVSETGGKVYSGSTASCSVKALFTSLGEAIESMSDFKDSTCDINIKLEQ